MVPTSLSGQLQRRSCSIWCCSETRCARWPRPKLQWDFVDVLTRFRRAPVATLSAGIRTPRTAGYCGSSLSVASEPREYWTKPLFRCILLTLCNSCLYNRGAGLAQWWERSPSTNVSRVRFPHSASYVGWVCWFSTLLREVFLQVLRFFPSPQKPTFDLI